MSVNGVQNTVQRRQRICGTAAFGIAESLPHHSRLVVGVVHASGDPAGTAQAATTARQHDHLQVPNASNIHAMPVTAGALAKAREHFDMLYLMPGRRQSGTLTLDF